MIFRKRRGISDADVTSGDIVYSALFDERIGRMPEAPALSASEALARWKSGATLSVLPAHAAGAVVEWSITARGGRGYVVNRYAHDGRRVQSVRWEQIGDRIRKAGGTAWFARGASTDPHPDAGYEVRWRTYDDGTARIETIGPSASDDDVLVLRGVRDQPDQRPAPGFGSVLGLRDADDVDVPAAVSDNPGVAAARYVKALCSGTSPRAADEIFGEDSLRDGAVVPATSGQIAEAVDRIQQERTSRSAVHDWLRLPVLRRGAASVLPLGAQGSLPAHWQSVAAQLADLSSSVRSALEFRAGQGVPLNVGEAVNASYGHALVASGAARATVWRDVPGSAVVMVTAGDPGAGSCSVALHIVPSDWVSSHPPREVVGDAAWSWADVVSWYSGQTGTAPPSVADNLAPGHKEGQAS